jgi:hypothetical protein
MTTKKKASAILCAALVCSGAFVFAGHPLPSGPAAVAAAKDAPAIPQIGTRESPLPASAPEHVIYRQFFRHALDLKEHARKLERAGKDGSKLRTHYQDKARLNDDQSRKLDKIIADYVREADQLDAKAKKLIDGVYARYPGGVVPAGEKLPPPPAELKELQRLRDYAVMRARHNMKNSLGDQGFRQIDDFLKVNFAPNVKPVPLTPRAGQPAPAGGRPR